MNQSETESLVIPTTYTLENKLCYIAIRHFLIDNLEVIEKEDNSEIKELTNKLRIFLISKFKFAFTKIELDYKDKLVKGQIEYTGGNPITFELLTSNN